MLCVPGQQKVNLPPPVHRLISSDEPNERGAAANFRWLTDGLQVQLYIERKNVDVTGRCNGRPSFLHRTQLYTLACCAEMLTAARIKLTAGKIHSATYLCNTSVIIHSRILCMK